MPSLAFFCQREPSPSGSFCPFHGPVGHFFLGVYLFPLEHEPPKLHTEQYLLILGPVGGFWKFIQKIQFTRTHRLPASSSPWRHFLWCWCLSSSLPAAWLIKDPALRSPQRIQPDLPIVVCATPCSTASLYHWHFVAAPNDQADQVARASSCHPKGLNAKAV